MENHFFMKLKEIDLDVFIKKVIVAFIGIMFMGFGIAFNAIAAFGNDPISVLYDGIKNFASIDLGNASMMVNCVLLLIIFLLDKRYINIGTFLYAFTLGLFINWGTCIYIFLSLPESIVVRIFSSILGCLLLFVGIAIYIIVNFGLDTWSGVTVILSEKVNISYKFAKIFMDAMCLLIGAVLGGKTGIATILAVLLGGPLIEKFKKMLDKTISSWIKIERVS